MSFTPDDLSLGAFESEGMMSRTVGLSQRCAGISHGATDKMEACTRLKVRVVELQHRTRELIVLVSSTVRQHSALSSPTEASRDELNHGLETLSRMQGLLSRAEEKPITLNALLRLKLEGLGAVELDKVKLTWPVVRIWPRSVPALALVLLELATKSCKCGVL
jgi:two-component sensor histidine kinase